MKGVMSLVFCLLTLLSSTRTAVSVLSFFSDEKKCDKGSLTTFNLRCNVVTLMSPQTDIMAPFQIPIPCSRREDYMLQISLSSLGISYTEYGETIDFLDFNKQFEPFVAKKFDSWYKSNMLQKSYTIVQASKLIKSTANKVIIAFHVVPKDFLTDLVTYGLDFSLDKLHYDFDELKREQFQDELEAVHSLGSETLDNLKKLVDGEDPDLVNYSLHYI